MAQYPRYTGADKEIRDGKPHDIQSKQETRQRAEVSYIFEDAAGNLPDQRNRAAPCISERARDGEMEQLPAIIHQIRANAYPMHPEQGGELKVCGSGQGSQPVPVELVAKNNGNGHETKPQDKLDSNAADFALQRSGNRTVT